MAIVTLLLRVMTVITTTLDADHEEIDNDNYHLKEKKKKNP